ncbi:MAG: hypothetical protein FD126_1847 [Elusimicrobia bacterium]|nr:MAG: hypothetical protein FD126_1847 [Elusimicrobiota bacterium]
MARATTSRGARSFNGASGLVGLAGRPARIVQAGGVELDEFEVAELEARPERHGHPVAGGHVGVRGVEVDLAGPARGEDDGLGPKRVDLPVGAQHVGAQTAVALWGGLRRMALQDEVHRRVALVEGDGGLGPAGLDQGALDLAAGQVPGMEDAALGMPAFEPQVRAVVAAAEFDPRLDEAPHAVGAVRDDGAHHVLPAQAGSGLQRVADVRLEGVRRVGDRRDAALGVGGVGAHQLVFGHHGHPAEGGQGARGREAGDAAAQD